MTAIEHCTNPPDNLKQVFAVAKPRGFPSARANTEYVVVELLANKTGLGSWNTAKPSVQLRSMTSKAPGVRLILQLPTKGTNRDLPLVPNSDDVFNFDTPMMFRL